MPINQDGAFESIRFTYQHETDDTFVLQIESHHTEMGPTITLHNLLDSGPLSLPLSVYTDIVDYLRSRGAIPGGVVTKMATGQVVRQPASRLQPTRVAGTVQRPQPTSNIEHRAAMEQPVYSPQHAVLTAEGAVDAAGTSHKQVKTAAPKHVVADAKTIDMDEPDPTDTGLDPSFSLEAAKAKKAEGHGRKGLKPAGRVKNMDLKGDDEMGT